ncbi:hypothetical protein BFDFBN_BFDFBN_17395, partial [Dysosmobacter welbionis]
STTSSGSALCGMAARSSSSRRTSGCAPPGGRWTSIGAGSRRRPCSWSPGWRRITSRRSTTMTRPWRL